jgi:formate dehydrogenase subunit delta
MSPDRLVYMANQIGQFFVYQREDEVVPGIASHIKKFWDPRMRQAIFAISIPAATGSTRGSRKRSRA